MADGFSSYGSSGQGYFACRTGEKKIDWAEAHMPVLISLRKKYEDSQPLKGQRVAGCLHVTKETGVLVRTLRAVGAELSWCACNPLSTQDDVAAPWLGMRESPSLPFGEPQLSNIIKTFIPQ